MLTLVMVLVTNKAVVMRVDFISYLGARGMCSGCLPALQPKYFSISCIAVIRYIQC